MYFQDLRATREQDAIEVANLIREKSESQSRVAEFQQNHREILARHREQKFKQLEQELADLVISSTCKAHIRTQTLTQIAIRIEVQAAERATVRSRQDSAARRQLSRALARQ